ncbi:MAG: IS630 family transposase [Acidobacteriota bacterium]|nr:IS630 family transposase [Acidobacteriota bacterium]
MEHLLWLYSVPVDPRFPVVCFDERPCFLLGDIVDPLPLQTGRVSKEHYAYEKNGSCALLAAIEPLTGKRVAQVYEHGTMLEYTRFMQQLAGEFPDAEKIRVVQDNLNTHTTASFYQHPPAAEAFELAQRFEFYYTPRCASWLNRIDIEFSALARQCLNRRIPTQEGLAKEVLAIVKERNDKRIKINWQFSIESARTKFNRHYHQVNADNALCQKT